MGQAVIFKAFALVVIGGLGNMTGALIVAIALGMIESWVGGFFGIVWQEGAVFTIMIVAVLLRPDGIFQRTEYASDDRAAMDPDCRAHAPWRCCSACRC